ncbi:hypothetical protein [Mycobacterium colombiense]
MVIAAIILLILAALGVLRTITLPLGLALLVLGIIWDIIAFTGHAVGAIF